MKRAPEIKGSVSLRAPEQVMRLKRLGSLHQCRLSFMRTLLRRLAREAWRFECRQFEIDASGVGHAVYSAVGPKRTYSLVAFAHDLPDELRSDRVIAEQWDATFTLFDGVPTAADIKRLGENVPYQEAGRVSAQELSLSRANRSVRLWKHVVDALSTGQQPDPDQVDAVGYLMRTTAVYGSGKFGAADREKICERDEMRAPFQAEMLSVYLTRWFVRDLVQHMARQRGGDRTAQLNPAIAAQLGVGNSTGLGMAPFIINHPVLFNNWILARETAIALVRGRERASPEEVKTFREVFVRACKMVDVWKSDHPVQQQKLTELQRDVSLIEAEISTEFLAQSRPWDRLLNWAANALSDEGQEFVASLILEPYGDLVDHLTNTMADIDGDTFRVRGHMRVSELRTLLLQKFDWALEIDWSAPESDARVWYVSEEKLEPRLGERYQEDIAPYEQPLCPARDAVATLRALEDWQDDQLVADFVLQHPEYRHSVRRAQRGQSAPYSDIRDNTVSAELMPIDMLRAKLSFFGATRFDPRSDRWVRICMFAGAPYPEDLTPETGEFWVYPSATA